jgi:hypothetical protein
MNTLHIVQGFKQCIQATEAEVDVSNALFLATTAFFFASYSLSFVSPPLSLGFNSSSFSFSPLKIGNHLD